MPPTITPQDFVTKWKQTALSERASAQEHFIDLCRLLGQQTPADADPTGAWYVFLKGAAQQGGGQGWADVWKRGTLAGSTRRGHNLTSPNGRRGKL